MGAFSSKEIKRFYVKGDHSDSQVFCVKIGADATVQDLLLAVQDFLRKKRIHSLGYEAQFFRINNRLVEPDVKVSTLTNSKEVPLQFCYRGNKLWVQVQSDDSVRTTVPFAIAVDITAIVSEAVMAIEIIQHTTRNFQAYGNGVHHIINASTGEPALLTDYICNLFESNGQDAPLRFVEAGPPEEPDAMIARAVIAGYLRAKAGATSSERSAPKRADGIKAQVGGVAGPT